MITAEVIKNLPHTDLTYVKGDLQNVAQKVLPPEMCDSISLVFVGKKEQLEQAVQKKAPIIVMHKSLAAPEDSGATFFSTPTIPLAMSQLLPLFDGKMNRFNQENKIHPQSFIHPTAHIGKNVTVGPFACIGEQARIGDGCTIGANTVVESYAVVGDHTILHPLVFVGSHCELGSHCEIHPHTTIGADGFSFAMNSKGEPQKIPQIGNVVIGNNVELGANCAVDRAALTTTRISDNTKMDNFCHIAHNVTIGKNGLMACGFRIAGSSHVGDNFLAGGEASIMDHITIGDRVVLAGRSGVTKDILEPGQYGGYPIEGFRDHLRTLKSHTQVPRLRKQLQRIMKHLNLQDEEEN